MQTFTSVFNILASIVAVLSVLTALYIVIRNKTVLPQKYLLPTIFISSLLAMIGSLIYSNIIGFTPCDLCWYQRIFMYPIVFISGYAMVKKDLLVLPYIKILAVVGGAIALFHNFIYYTDVNPFPCSATASCTARYVFEFGFVTIPFMSIAFFLLILTILFQRNKSVPSL